MMRRVGSTAILSRLFEEGQEIHLKARGIFFSQGDPADSVFYLGKGRVKVTTTSREGKEAVMAMHGPGEFFGEGSLTGQTHRISTVSAILPSAAFRIETAIVLRLLHDDPVFSEFLVRFLLARNVRMEADLIDQLFNSSEKRLARLLLLLSNFEKDGSPQPISEKLSQGTLAEMIGTTRSRVSFFMNRFRRFGFIDYSGTGHLKVHRSLLNVLLYDDPNAMRTAKHHSIRDSITSP
jgi:CRP/FNR family transcriptional regulator, cyclic AMP receptor protein